MTEGVTRIEQVIQWKKGLAKYLYDEDPLFMDGVRIQEARLHMFTEAIIFQPPLLMVKIQQGWQWRPPCSPMHDDQHLWLPSGYKIIINGTNAVKYGNKSTGDPSSRRMCVLGIGTR